MVLPTELGRQQLPLLLLQDIVDAGGSRRRRRWVAGQSLQLEVLRRMVLPTELGRQQLPLLLLQNDGLGEGGLLPQLEGHLARRERELLQLMILLQLAMQELLGVEGDLGCESRGRWGSDAPNVVGNDTGAGGSNERREGWARSNGDGGRRRRGKGCLSG